MLKRIAALCLALLMVSACSLAEQTLTMAGLDTISAHDWSNNHALERIEERSGIHFTYQQSTESEAWTQLKQDMLSGKAALPDVLFKADLTAAEQQAMYEKGLLIDLRPYLQEYAPNLYALLQAHPEWEKAISLADGAIVALPNINELQNNNAMWINTAWLKRLGLQVPTTAEELTEVLRAFKTRDPNNNGKKDEVPLTFTGMWDLRWLAHAFGIYSNDYYVVVENGTVRQTMTSDENRAFLTWAHQLYQEGLIDNTGFTTTESTRQITDSSADITFGIVLGPSILNLLPSAQMDNYKVLLPLTYNGTQVYRQLISNVTLGTFAVTSACADPAAMVAWVDFFYTEEGCYLTQSGMKDKEYEIYSDGSWHWIDNAETVSETILPDFTIAGGTSMPGYVPVAYQLSYDDAQTHSAVVQLAELDQYAALPYPQVYLTTENGTRLAAIWKDLGEWAETEMARFVVGDYQLNDSTWAAFCQEAERRGLSEMVTLWQDALK